MRRERRAIYRITIENVIPASSAMGGSITQCTEAALLSLSAVLLLFCRNEYVFISSGIVQMAQKCFYVDQPQEEKEMVAILHKLSLNFHRNRRGATEPMRLTCTFTPF